MARRGQRDRLETLRGQVVEQERQDIEHDRPAARDSRPWAVMEQQYVARPESACKSLQYSGRAAFDRIVAAPRPGYVAQTAFRQHGIEQRAAESYWSAEKRGILAGNTGNRVLGRLHLAP